MLSVEHVVLLELQQQLLPLVQKRSAQKFAATGRLHNLVDVELLVPQAFLSTIVKSQVSVVSISALAATAKQPDEYLLGREAQSVPV